MENSNLTTIFYVSLPNLVTVFKCALKIFLISKIKEKNKNLLFLFAFLSFFFFLKIEATEAVVSSSGKELLKPCHDF